MGYDKEIKLLPEPKSMYDVDNLMPCKGSKVDSCFWRVSTSESCSFTTANGMSISGYAARKNWI